MLTGYVAVRMKFSPRSGREFVELAALPFPDDLHSPFVAGPAPKHVPNEEVHDRMAVRQHVECVRNAAEQQSSKVGADPKVREPAFHRAILRAPTRIEMARSNTQEKCEGKTRIFVLGPFRSRANQRANFRATPRRSRPEWAIPGGENGGVRGISSRSDRSRLAGWRRSLRPRCRRSPRQRSPVRVRWRERSLRG